MPLHKTRKWRLCLKLTCHNFGNSSFTAGVNMPTSRCCGSGPGGGLGLPKVSELVKGRASCHKTATNIYKWQF